MPAITRVLRDLRTRDITFKQYLGTRKPAPGGFKETALRWLWSRSDLIEPVDEEEWRRWLFNSGADTMIAARGVELWRNYVSFMRQRSLDGDWDMRPRV